MPVKSSSQTRIRLGVELTELDAPVPSSVRAGPPEPALVRCAVATARSCLLITIVIACKGAAHQQTEISNTPAPATTTCMEYFRAVIEHKVRCESSAAWLGPVDQQLEDVRPSCTEIAAAPGAHLEADPVARCAADLKALPCFNAYPQSCRHIAGTLPAGSPCAYSLQCGAGQMCTAAGPQSCGVCAPLAGGGEPCGVGCAWDLVCISGRCSAPRGAGESCRSDSDCIRPLRCPSRSSFTPTCVRALGEGDACQEDLDCPVTLRCTAGACRKRPPPQPPGASCESPLDCLGLSCVDKRCVAPGREGESCGGEHTCASSYVCDQGVCRLPRAADCH